MPIIWVFTDSSDFITATETVLFTAESTAGETHCASFTILDDDTVEANEHFVVIASQEDLFSNSTATIIIADNDSKECVLILFL